jgi:alpha-N-arabinofuranosidase
MSVDASKTGEPIHPYVYGQFTELLFNLFEKGLWAEMLSDRKFFYPVDSSEELNPANRKRNFNRWRPIGSDEFVVMDRTKAFVGEHAPRVRLEGETPHGMAQAGLALRRGRRYRGRIALAGGVDAAVEISLVWGEGRGDRQTITLSSLSDEYVRFPLSFTSGGDTDAGRLEITGTGSGSFHVGVVSLMPADNVHGFRADMVALLKDLDSGIYRWPGGNFVSGYDWRDGIGDPDERPPRYDHAWRTVEYNDVGTDEFLTLCRMLGIDAYICVNAGFGDAHSAAKWVEYVNGSLGTPMGRRRAANGHPEPWGVTWWGIGNEMYWQWQLGHMHLDHYVLKHNEFARTMRAVDPTIEIVASGATPFETSTTARHHRKPLPARLPYEYGTPQDWSGQLLAHSSDYFDYLAEHLYPVTGSAFDVDRQAFVEVDDPLVDQVRRVPNRVRATVEAWQVYLERMPFLRDRGIKLAIDEWAGGGRRTFTSTLCAAEGLHEMFRHSDVITMAAYTAFISQLSFDGAESTYSPTGLMLRLYRQRLGTIPIEVTGNAPQRPLKGTVGVDLPSTSSGSDTWPLDVVAALDGDRTALTVAIVNPTEAPQSIRVAFDNVDLQGRGTKWEIAADDLQARNVAGEEPEVILEEHPLEEVPATLRVAPLSVSLYRFEAR